ncbi:hypothetical protein, partial [Bacillus cereus]|uniref:hypothetical protein n=1 Tax=Bacillus cereus TaxID=1396 RepID=UPI0021125A9F|nr:hypothetical protein [Bacillus cereus]
RLFVQNKRSFLFLFYFSTNQVRIDITKPKIGPTTTAPNNKNSSPYQKNRKLILLIAFIDLEI